MGVIRIRETLRLTPFLLSDGGLSAKANKSWVAYFRNNSLVVIKEFRNKLYRCCKKEGYLTKRKDGSYEVKLTYQKLGEKLLELVNSYRSKKCKHQPICPKIKGKRGSCRVCTYRKEDDYPKTRIPSEIFLNYALMKYFLRVYSTCDGGIGVTVSRGKYPFLIRKVFIAVQHPQLTKDLLKILKLLGIKAKFYENEIRITSKEDIVKFSKIGFIRGCKVGKISKVFSGYKKNFVLKKVKESYENPKKLIMFLQKATI